MSSIDRMLGRTVVVDFSLSGGDFSFIAPTSTEVKDFAPPSSGSFSSDREWRFRVAFPPLMSSLKYCVYFRGINELGEESWEKLDEHAGIHVHIHHQEEGFTGSPQNPVPRRNTHVVPLWRRHIMAIAMRKLIGSLSSGLTSMVENGSVYVSL